MIRAVLSNCVFSLDHLILTVLLTEGFYDVPFFLSFFRCSSSSVFCLVNKLQHFLCAEVLLHNVIMCIYVVLLTLVFVILYGTKAYFPITILNKQICPLSAEYLSVCFFNPL